VARENSAGAKTNNALSFRHTASSTLQSVANKFSKGSTNDKTVKNDTDVVDNEDKMVAVEDLVTVKTQNTFNDFFISNNCPHATSQIQVYY
jgi:hypothetical protein